MSGIPSRVAILAPIHVAGLLGHIAFRGPASSLPAGMGGYCINELIEARLRRGLRTDVVTLDPGAGDDITRMEGPLLRIWVVRRRKSGAVRDLFAAERRLMMAALDEAGPELLHANWTYEYGLTAARQSRYPYLLTVHDHARHCLRRLGWQYLPLYLIARYVLRRSRHVTAVSPYVSGYLQRILRRPVPVIPNCLPGGNLELHARFRPPLSDGRLAVASALSWAPFKNVRRALRAFALVRRELPDATYDLAGPGLGKDGPARRWACREGLADNVTFHGVLLHDELMRVFGESDVILHPSLEESLPGPLIEGMALGRIVIAGRDSGGCAWALDAGRAGVLTDMHSVQAIAGALLDCVRHSDEHRKLAEHGRKFALERYDPETVVDRYEEAYRLAAQPS